MQFSELKLFFRLIFAILFFVVLSSPAGALTEIVFWNGTLPLEESRVFVISARGIDQTELIACDLSIDTSFLTIESVEAAPALSNASIISTTQNSLVRIALISHDPSKFQLPEFTPIIEISIRSTGKQGISELKILNAFWSDEFLVRPFDHVEGGTIWMQGSTYGDANTSVSSKASIDNHVTTDDRVIPLVPPFTPSPTVLSPSTATPPSMTPDQTITSTRAASPGVMIVFLALLIVTMVLKIRK